MEPLTIEVEVILSQDEAHGEVLLESTPTLLILHQDYLEVQSDYHYKRKKVPEEDDDGDEVLKKLMKENQEDEFEQEYVYSVSRIRRSAISSISLTYSNHYKVFYILIGARSAPDFHVKSKEVGLTILNELLSWWEKPTYPSWDNGYGSMFLKPRR
jgi:hypothetical protein